jgi:large subunit ribosomal protein L5
MTTATPAASAATETAAGSARAEETARPRLRTRYVEEIRPALQEQFRYGNVMQIPGVVKVVVNMGVGEAARDAKLIEGAVRDLATITGQKPEVTKARKSIAQFKLREGMPIGANVTLRGDRMWEFLDRLITMALPRIRDFRGLSDRQFDGNGNYTFGLHEQSMFHEIDSDRIDRRARHGHHRGDHRDHRRRGPGAAASASASRSRRADVARPPWSTRPSASRSSRCVPIPGAAGAAGRTRSTASSACAGSACGRWRTPASCRA